MSAVVKVCQRGPTSRQADNSHRSPHQKTFPKEGFHGTSDDFPLLDPTCTAASDKGGAQKPTLELVAGYLSLFAVTLTIMGFLPVPAGTSNVTNALNREKNLGSFRQIAGAIGHAFGDGRVRGILAVTLALVFWASVFYRFVEGWSWLDSIYFSVIAISTVGFGDISPETAGGKIFTMFYIVVGLGVFVTAATTVADSILSHYRDEENSN